mmetsp:Transcript_15616/g.39732  ORF Transcript_15616/g.39732 Transcript_15616/m.39732 type:complete len:274 (-) Transcript_15616:200-1021(-)
MPVTTSADNAVPLGTRCPSLAGLADCVTGQSVSLEVLRGAEGFKGLVVMFICNHCPVVGHLRGAIQTLVEIYEMEGIAFVAIQPDETNMTPMNGAIEMRAEKDFFGYSFPYCFDGDKQVVSRAFGAVLTPDFFVYDTDLKLVYRGSFDATRPANKGMFQPGESLFKEPGVCVGATPDGAHLRAALDALLLGDAAQISKIPEHPSEGCSIKWLPGKDEPAWSHSEYGGQYYEHHMAWNRRYHRWRLIYDVVFFFLKFAGFKRPALGNELSPGGL